MYKTCMFCNRPLGANQVLEHFPVGRRLAFDAERGRLWVVCRKCERWNLSPIEERWEAVGPVLRVPMCAGQQQIEPTVAPVVRWERGAGRLQ